MLARKLAAIFLVLVFIVLALPNFLIYALSKTYLNPDFYRRDDLITGVYDYVVDKTEEVLREESDAFKGYFTAQELKGQIKKVFTKQIFAGTLNDFADQIETYKSNPDQPLIVSLRVLRENLLTVSNNLAYTIYQNLPTCSDDALALAGGKDFPSCVPKSVPYDQVVKPLTDHFETSIYQGIPEQLSNIEQAVPVRALVEVENYRNMSFLVLIIILALIVLIIYDKISSTVSYIGAGFLLGGGIGYGFSYVINTALTQSNAQFSDARSKDFLAFLISFLTEEVQRLAILFIITGVVLFVIRFILKNTVESKPALNVGR